MKKIAVVLAWLLLGLASTHAQFGPNASVPTGATQNNPSATTDPTVSNDSTQGYSVGSIWQNSTTGRIWVARGVAVGAAIWTLLEFSDHPGYIASNWYLPMGATGTVVTGGNPGANNIKLFPGYIKERITINALGVRVATLSAGGNVQAAIYANNAATGRPTGNALASTASMSTASVANVNAAVSVQVEPGLYWFATCMDNATATLAALSNTSTIGMTVLVGSATQANDLAGGGLVGLTVSGTFGTWPSMTGQTFTENNNTSAIGLVQFEVGSVP